MKFIELTKVQVIEPIGEATEDITINPLHIKVLKEIKGGGCLLIMCDEKEILVKENKYEIINLIKK
ncbi:MAG: hypothetical protein KGV44_04810 [Flavobacteriaceae bacterium]|nr:hypothetical protein [Flavobacteriaceae bacterium]